MRIILCSLLVLGGLTLARPQAALACPLCREAVAASSSDSTDGTQSEAGANFPQAMNLSIKLMLVVPYTCLAVVGFLVYRGMKQNEAYLQAREEEGDAQSS